MLEDGGARAERGEVCIAIVGVSIAILIAIAIIAIAPTITITNAAINITIAPTTNKRQIHAVTFTILLHIATYSCILLQTNNSIYA